MKDRALELVATAHPSRRAGVLREYLQAHLLYSMQSAGAFRRLVFQGGTCLRFVHGLPRHSEDLDFCLEGRTMFDLGALFRRCLEDLLDSGFQATLHAGRLKVVRSAFIRFSGLLYEAGLSPHRDEKVAVKVEVDTRPPRGAGTSRTVIQRHFMLSLWHHDLPSLMAGKLHAVLSRGYTKGRDLYDLLWYLTRPEQVEPNLAFLRSALTQTHWKGSPVRRENWKEVVSERLQALDWKVVRRDVEPFLENPAEAQMITRDNLVSVLRR